MRPEDLSPIIDLLKASTGFDFTRYKAPAIRRMVFRRMLLHKLDTLPDYRQYLDDHVSEITALYETLLIHITGFFWDPDTADRLTKTVIPGILKAKAPGEPIRVWAPACSTGEEVYTLAILFLEAMEELSSPAPLKISGTDEDETALSRARLGLYSMYDLAPVTMKRVQRYFVRLDGHYQASKALRDVCDFARHDVLKDPPRSRVDLISSCNLLVYLEPGRQKKAMTVFHDSLDEKGILVLGESESTGNYPQLFRPVDKHAKVFVPEKAGVYGGMSSGVSSAERGAWARTAVLPETSARALFRRNQRVARLQQEIATLKRDMEQFTYVASHDLQEPLRKILTFSDRLESHKVSMPDDGRNYIDKITGSAQHLSKLIDDLLVFLKTSANNEPFLRLAPDKLLRDELVAFALTISDKNARVKIDPLPAIQGIRTQIAQLFYQLLGNALKFTRKDVPPVIQISGRKVPPDETARHKNLDTRNAYVEIIFRDNGIGFREEYAEQIFTLFQRLHDKSHYPGTGTGLAICRKIVEYHGGRIIAQPVPEGGAAFHIFLPEGPRF